MQAVVLRGGSLAIPMRIEFLMDRLALVNALAWTEREWAENELLPDLTRGQVVERIRETLYQGGTETSAYWRDSVHDEDRQDVVEAWATALVERTFGKAFTRYG